MTRAEFLAHPRCKTHEGRPCPVPLNSRPTVLFRDGSIGAKMPARTWTDRRTPNDFWKWVGNPEDNIIAYIPEEDSNG